MRIPSARGTRPEPGPSGGADHPYIRDRGDTSHSRAVRSSCRSRPMHVVAFAGTPWYRVVGRTGCFAVDSRHQVWRFYARSLLRSRCVLDGRAHRARRERRAIRRAPGRPRQRRAAGGGLPQAQSVGAGAGAEAGRWQAARRKHRDPALSRQAVRTVAERPGRRSRGAVADRLLCSHRAYRLRPCRPAGAIFGRSRHLPRPQGDGAQGLPRLLEADRRNAGRAGMVLWTAIP